MGINGTNWSNTMEDIKLKQMTKQAVIFFEDNTAELTNDFRQDALMSRCEQVNIWGDKTYFDFYTPCKFVVTKKLLKKRIN